MTGTAWLIIGALTVVLMVLGGYTKHYHDEQQALMHWVDERDNRLIPVMQAVAAVVQTGRPHHSVREADGVMAARMVEVKVDPDNLPEGENWRVIGDKVFVERAEFIPSRTGVAQIELLLQQEQSREDIRRLLVRHYAALAEWEQAHPVPGQPPVQPDRFGGLRKIRVDRERYEAAKK